jgi:hypothetical protein
VKNRYYREGAKDVKIDNAVKLEGLQANQRISPDNSKLKTEIVIPYAGTGPIPRVSGEALACS